MLLAHAQSELKVCVIWSTTADSGKHRLFTQTDYSTETVNSAAYQEQQL